MTRERVTSSLRALAAVAFVFAGLLHLVRPDLYLPLIPEAFGAPRFWNALVGVAEIAGGVGLLVPRLRRAAAIGLALLLVVLTWVHIEMLTVPGRELLGQVPPRWLLWGRLAFQPVLIAWVLAVGVPSPLASTPKPRTPMPPA